MRELAVLWMRQLWLYTLACQTRSRLVLSLKEHPRDFEEYKSVNDTNEYPSFYAWQEFRARFGMKEVRLDMGALGHQCRKPTTLGTNIPHWCSFEGLSDSRDHGQSIDPNASIEARVQQSRGWAAWLERFKEEIVKGILLVVDQQGDIDFPDGNPNVAKMTAEQWRSRDMSENDEGDCNSRH